MKLNSCPFEFPIASATQWKEYLLVLASDGTALIYNTIQKMWSMLPKCSYTKENNSISLVCYKGQVTAVTRKCYGRSTVVEFNSELGKWQESQVITPSDGQTISLAVTDNKLYACKGDELQSLSDEGWKVEYKLTEVFHHRTGFSLQKKSP